MNLTHKQEAFCAALAHCGDVAEAYRRVYATDGLSPRAVEGRARALLARDAVAARVALLRSAAPVPPPPPVAVAAVAPEVPGTGQANPATPPDPAVPADAAAPATAPAAPATAPAAPDTRRWRTGGRESAALVSPDTGDAAQSPDTAKHRPPKADGLPADSAAPANSAAPAGSAASNAHTRRAPATPPASATPAPPQAPANPATPPDPAVPADAATPATAPAAPAGAACGTLTLETHLTTLAMLRDLALEAEKYSSAIQAEISRGRAAGLYTDRLQAGTGGQDGAAMQEELIITFVRADHD